MVELVGIELLRILKTDKLLICFRWFLATDAFSPEGIAVADRVVVFQLCLDSGRTPIVEGD